MPVVTTGAAAGVAGAAAELVDEEAGEDEALDRDDDVEVDEESDVELPHPARRAAASRAPPPHSFARVLVASLMAISSPSCPSAAHPGSGGFPGSRTCFSCDLFAAQGLYGVVAA
jgi:hypothetical protein